MKNVLILVFILFAYGACAQMEHMHHEGMEMEQMPEMKPGQVTISKDRQQLIGVKTGYARIMPLKKIIRTVGTVAYDPELYSAQTEYTQAVAAREKAKENGDPKIIENAEELISAAQLKLKRLGLNDELIEETAGGEDSLLVGAENGLVWIYGKIYENEIPLVKEGMMAHITSKNLPGKMFMGNIASIDTVLDEMTRSLKVRAAVTNHNGLLKPNMYVDIAIESPLGKKLAVPEDAIMDTGERQIVYIIKKDGIFEPRKVVVGQRADGLVEILKGLKAGEKIVTSGTFLIDSESKLKSTGSGGHVH